MTTKWSRNFCLANDKHSYYAMLIGKDGELFDPIEMTFQSVKSKVHLFTDDTLIYLVVKCTVDCLQLQQDLLRLETGNQIKKWISIPLNAVLVTRLE